jgi:hypothetical protein
MQRRYRIAWLLFIAVCSTGCLSVAQASPDSKSHIDLPAEALGTALRDLAIQAKCNISYEPSAVSGLSAPAIKGEFTLKSALSILLAGTRLEVINVNDNTFQVTTKRDQTRASPPDAASKTPEGLTVVNVAYRYSRRHDPPDRRGCGGLRTFDPG